MNISKHLRRESEATVSMDDPRSIGTQPPEPVSPVGAVKNFYGRYARFSGRASRSEYWWIALASFLVSAAFNLIMGAFHGGVVGGLGDQDLSRLSSSGTAFLVLGWVVSLIHFIPGLSLAVRRLHDVNRSGWWVLLSLSSLVALVLFVPLIASSSGSIVLVWAVLALLVMLAGPLALLIMALLPSNARGVRFDRASDF